MSTCVPDTNGGLMRVVSPLFLRRGRVTHEGVVLLEIEEYVYSQGPDPTRGVGPRTLTMQNVQWTRTNILSRTCGPSPTPLLMLRETSRDV